MTTRVKLLVFAHKPPPHHGQSYMVQQFLAVCGGDCRENPARSAGSPDASPGAGAVSLDGIECYHVDCRLSDSMEDIGQAGGRKVLRLLKYCLEAIVCRLRHGPMDFLYVPAPSQRAPLYRDWLVMLCCRLIFRRIFFYWHAAGLGEWLATSVRPWERWISRLLLRRPHLSIVLGEYNRADAAYFESRHVAMVPNCIPDPCPQYETEVRPGREDRARRRAELVQCPPVSTGADTGTAEPAELFRMLFIGVCTREKGLFDATEATVLANRELARRGSRLRVQLTVAGKFWREEERREFEARLRQPDLTARLPGSDEPAVNYRGFVGGDEKKRLFTVCDCLCFPTYYSAESFGLVIIEAMAHGMDIVTTRWRTIPELFPPGFSGLVEPRSPEALAAAMLGALERLHDPAVMRRRYLDFYTMERYGRDIRAAFRMLTAG